MSYANNITHKCQLSAQAYLQAAVTAGTITLIASSSIFAGLGLDSITSRRVVCTSRQAQMEETQFNGNWMAELEIVTRAPFSDFTEPEFHALCSEVWAHFFVSEETLLTGLSNETIGFTAFKAYKRSQGWDVEPGADGKPAEWVSNLRLDVKCAGTFIS